MFGYLVALAANSGLSDLSADGGMLPVVLASRLRIGGPSLLAGMSTDSRPDSRGTPRR